MTIRGGGGAVAVASAAAISSRNVPAMTSLPTMFVTNFATMMKAGPYGAVVVVQIGLTLSSNGMSFSIGPTT